MSNPERILFPMRDDVHRRAPVPPRWRALLKACGSEASTKEKGDLAAARVMQQELRAGLPPAFQSALRSATRDRQPTLTSALDLAGSARGAPLAVAVATTLALRHPTGAVNPKHVGDAVCTVAQATAAAYVRELDGYLAVEAPRDRKRAVARMEAVLGTVDLPTMAQQIVRGEQVSVRRYTKKRLGADEDVR
jgi:hypothetical protein